MQENQQSWMYTGTQRNKNKVEHNTLCQYLHKHGFGLWHFLSLYITKIEYTEKKN